MEERVKGRRATGICIEGERALDMGSVGDPGEETPRRGTYCSTTSI